jgi:hypothetical protein
MGFTFPKPGDYRLDISIENAPQESVYHYGIDLGLLREPAGANRRRRDR